MKKAFFLIICTFFCVSYAFASPQPIKFEVYPSSASVYFSADIDKETDIMIPASFSPQSVKIVSVSGTSLTSFKTETGVGSLEAPYYLKEDKKELEELDGLLNGKSSKLSGLELSAVLLDNLGTENVKTAELASFLASAAALREKTAKNIYTLNNEIRLLKEKIKLKQDNYNKKLPADYLKSTAIKISATGKGKIIFKAETNNAGWKPVYSLDLNSKTGEIKGSLAVAVKQNTGMRWSGSIEFYSAQPSKNLYYRELQPLVISLESNMPSPVPRNMAMGSKAIDLSAETEAPVNQTATETGVYFRVNATINGDGADVNVPVNKFSLSSKAGYEVTPEFSKFAVLISDIKNLPQNILAAKAELSIDGEYSGENYLPITPKGARLIIPFGQSKNITAEKTLQIAKNKDSILKGILKDGYFIKAHNGLDRAVQLTVIDRVPVSSNEKISVSKVSISPQATPDDKGIIKWNLNLKPKETKTLNVSYEIKYPSDAEITFR